MKQSVNRKIAIIALLVMLIGATVAALAGCNVAGYIDAPDKLQAELGVYVVPDYNVVDSDGMILAGYNVTLKSVTNENGESVDFTPTTVTISEQGVYKFVYTASSSRVKDVTVSIDFADRTAPKVNFDKNSLPTFYITGNSYRIPQYTLSGDYVREKCYVKVVHIAEDKTETEAEIKSNRFTVTEKSGLYAIRIHVEDAVGNVNDYEYIKPVDGPEVAKDNVVLYLDEEFGERQVYCYESSYSGKFVSKDDPDAKVHGDEQGSYKVKFNGVETYNNEGYIVMNVPAILDISNCIELEMWVYNDNDTEVRMGSTWWNDTVLKAKDWTRVTWSVQNWGKSGPNSTSSTVDKVTQYVGVSDISKMALRFIFDYEGNVAPNGTFYLSSMRVVPKVQSIITTDDNVSLDKNFYGVGDEVTLTAQEIDGQIFDCFLVDNKPIAGNVFVARETEHTVTARYKSDLTADNMTWMTTEQPETVGSDAKVYKIGSDENWVITYDVYGVNSGWCYFGVYVGGSDQLFGVELSDAKSSKLSAYGGSWKCMDGVKLSQGYYDALRSATQDNPAHFIFMRQGDKISAYIGYNSELHLIGSVQFADLEISGNSFGIGERIGKDLTNATLANIKIIAGETKTQLFAETLVSNITTANVTTDKQSYLLGDTATITADKAPEGQVLAYYKVDGVRISGNTFVVTSTKHTVEAVYLLPEETYEVKVDEYDEYVKITDGSLTLPNAKVVDLDGNVKDYDITITVTDRSGKQYPVIDGKIAIDYVGSLRLTVTYSVEELNNRSVTIYIVVQSGETLYAPTEDNVGLIGMDNVVFDATKKHGDDEGSLKYTPIQGDDHFTLDYFDFRGYDFVEFYVYTNDDGIEAGSWWLGDTKLVKGEWTKVVIDLKGNVYLKYENGNEFVPNNNKDKPYAGKFIVRIMHAANKDVWISSVKAGLWPTATIETDDNVTLDKEGYKLHDKVVLTAKDAPEGKRFLHFTVNGNVLEGNSFVVNELTYEVKAVYADLSTVTLATGISTADGEIVYAIGETVTLVFNGTVPDKQFFNHFIVDGQPLSGNTFVASAAKHTVGVAFASTVDQMTWTTAEFVQPEGSDAQKTKLGEGANWVLIYDIYGLTGECFFGAYVGGTDQLYGYELSNDAYKLSGYGGNWKNMDGVKLSESICNIIRNATEQKPVRAIYARSGESITAYIEYDGIIYLVGSTQYSAFGITGDSFGLGGRANRVDGTITNIKFVVGDAKTQAYLNSLTITINKTNVTTDKDVYTFGETVTLTANAPESGMAFSHFTLDGVRLDGTTFVVTKTLYKVVAVYSEISTLQLENGIVTSDGKTVYARGTNVTLQCNDVADGKIFDYFKVDGERIVGHTFTASNATHAISAVFVDKVEDLTWVTSAEADESEVKYNWNTYKFDGKAVDAGDYWVLNAQIGNLNNFEDGKDQWYGFDILVGTNASIHIRLHTKSGLSITAMGTTYADGVSLGTVLNGDAVIAACKQSTDEKPVTFTVIRNGRVFYVLFNNELILKTEHDFASSDNKFGIGTTNCGWLPLYAVTAYEYRTGSEVVADKLTVKAQGTNVTLDKADGIYKLGDTATLTAAPAEAGFKFSCFKVNGVRIEGNTFVITTKNVDVKADYEDERQIKVEDMPVNGSIVKITNDEYTLPTAKILDANETELNNLDLTVTVTDAAGNLYDVAIDGKITIAYKGVIDITVTYASEELNKKVSFTVTLQRSDSNVIMQASETGAKTILSNSSTITFDSEKKHGDDEGSVKLTVNAAVENQDYGYLNVFDVSAYDFVELYVYTDVAGLQMGCWWYGDTNLVQNEWTLLRFDIKSDNIKDGRWILRFIGSVKDANFWISSIVGKRYTVSAVNSIENATAKDGSAVEFVQNIPEGINDVNFTDNGALKVTAASNDVGLTTSTTLMTDASQFGEIYFYVYIESEEDLNYVAGGAWWTDGGMIQANKWCKITFNSDLIKKLSDGANTDLSKFTFRIFSQHWNEGYSSITGKTIYVTSLYGAYKA